MLEKATGSDVLVETVESLTLQLLRFLTPRDELTDAASIVEQIAAIADAAEPGDADRAGDLIHDLHESTRSNFLTLYLRG